MKFKLIIIYPEDKLKLQRFLNEQSANGWHAKKIGIFGIHMTYDESIQYTYEVLFSSSVITANNGPADYKRHEDLFAEFNYESILATRDFMIYRTVDDSEVFTDSELRQEDDKIAYKKILLGTLAIPFIVMMNLFSVSQSPMIYNLTSPLMIPSIATQVTLIIFWLIRIKNILKMKKGQMNDDLNSRWSFNHHDPFTLAFGFIFIIFLLTLLPQFSPTMFIFLMIAVVLFIIDNLNIAKVRKYLLMVLVVILGVNILVRATLSEVHNSTNNIDTSNIIINNSSFIASLQMIYNDDNLIDIVESKISFFDEFVIKSLLKEQNISVDVPLEQLTEVIDDYGMRKFVYRDKSKIVVSDEALPESFYLEFNQQ